MGLGRSALSAARIALPYVGSARDQGSHCVSSSDAEERRLLAAVRLRDGKFLFRREIGRFNGETFWEFLKGFREVSAVPGRRVLAISDNAQYHRSQLHLE